MTSLPNKVTIRRLTAENPIEQVFSRLKQFASVRLAENLLHQRTIADGIELSPDVIESKAIGIAFSMRSALDYFASTANEKLNRRILSLYYGSIALAQAEMLAAPSGPGNLDEVEAMTMHGHGLYVLSAPSSRFADLRVGVLATGFLSSWMQFLGHDTSGYPRRKPRSMNKFSNLPPNACCTLRDLFASTPEIEDLFADVFGGAPRWISVAHDLKANYERLRVSTKRMKGVNTFVRLADRSGQVRTEVLKSAGWPLVEIQRQEEDAGKGSVFHACVDHAGHDYWHQVLPIHSSPFRTGFTLLFPTLGLMREYRVIATATLYALSIMARYLPSAWWRVEGGSEDQYLALVEASLAVWERLLPEHFLESIAGERVVTAQPGSLWA